MARAPDPNPSPWRKRGGERRPVPPVPAHRDPKLCPECDTKAPLHLYIMTPNSVAVCPSAHCTWLTCVHCGITFDTEAELTIKSVWTKELQADIDRVKE